MKHRRWFAAVSGVALALGLAAGIQAQTGNGYDLTWHTLAAGGGSPVAGNGYTLVGIIGQSDAGAAAGGGYTLDGGFLYAGTLRAYLPTVLRNP
jgi:hypothetical protein